MKPILFNTEMVRAILEGRKTVTRRVLKAPVISKVRTPDNVTLKDGVAVFKWNGPDIIGGFEKKAPYRPGDILYVRETWAKWWLGGYIYKADNPSRKFDAGHWAPSIHMPKKAARLFLRVTDVRAERLQDIKNDGTVDEGAVKRPNYTKRGDLVLHNRYRVEFSNLWNSTIKPADRAIYGWEANPYVWVIEFERISKEEAMKYA